MLALLTMLVVLAGAAFTFGLVRAVASEIPTLDPARQRSAGEVDSVLYASNGRRVLAVLRGAESRVLVRSIDEISPIMRQAIVSVEDKRFYEHRGVDLQGILRALWQDIRQQKVVEGGSTITQQFVKNAYVRNEKTVARKVREAALSWQLEQRWSKDRILVAYLNTIYFGNGAYGVQQAARTYFGKGARRLNLAEAALLAGLPSDPSRYDPVTRPAAAAERRRFVLRQMYEQGKITLGQRRWANGRPLPKPEDVRLPGTRGPAPYFVNYVKDQLVERYGARRVFGGGMRATTTIDLELQELARRAIRAILPNEDGPAAALVAIDPRDGAVRAMVGGTNFRKSQFNLATQAERQPGSSFKPIVLAAAMRQGISPQTTFESRPVEIDAGNRVWSVKNYEGSYLGRVDLARAMVSSDNAVYAQLTQLVGPKAIVETAHLLGVRSALQAYFSIGLGAVAVNPLDMARAFATFANGGRRVDGSLLGDRPRVVERVEWPTSDEARENRPVERQVLREDEAALLTSILQRVVTSGTGRLAAIPGRSVAGKTGTTDEYGDAWFVGYTPQLAVAVWVGYPNELRAMRTEYGGRPVAGGTLPALIWKDFVARALPRQGAEADTFPPAPSIPAEWRRVIFRDGAYKLANAYCPVSRSVVYFSGRGPSEDAGCKPNEVTVPALVGESIETARARLEERPLAADVVFVPATLRLRPGLVVRQEPRGGGFLSANSTVRLWVTRARYGLVPNLVGSSARDAATQLERLQLKPHIAWGKGPRGTVVAQSPRAGVAAQPGLAVRIVVAR